MPAHGASLRRIRSRDLFDPTISLVLQARGEQTPTTAADRPVKPTLLSNPDSGLLYGSPRAAGHRRHVEGFDPDRVKALRNIGGRFLDPVLAPIGLARLKPCDRKFRAGTPCRASLGPGQSLLQYSQPLGFTTTQARSMKEFSGRQRRGHGNSAVDTDHAAIPWPTDRVGDVSECDMPTAGPIPSDPVGLNARGHRPRQPKPHPTHLRHPQTTKSAVQTLHVMRSDRDLPKPLVHTGLTPRRTTVRAVEEVVHGLRKIAQRLLLNGLRTGRQPVVFGAGLSQLRGLLAVARGAAARPPVPLLLDSQVPHIPRVATMLGQSRRLLGSGKQPIMRTKAT